MPRATNGKGGKGGDYRPVDPNANQDRVRLHKALFWGEITRQEFEKEMACLGLIHSKVS